MLRQEKRNSAQKFITEFPKKSWILSGLKELSRKIDTRAPSNQSVTAGRGRQNEWEHVLNSWCAAKISLEVAERFARKHMKQKYKDAKVTLYWKARHCFIYIWKLITLLASNIFKWNFVVVLSQTYSESTIHNSVRSIEIWHFYRKLSRGLLDTV